jgi:hypothetical protein
MGASFCPLQRGIELEALPYHTRSSGTLKRL